MIQSTILMFIAAVTYKFNFVKILASGNVRSGRAYHVSNSTPDYEPLEEPYGPSRHYTIIFNTFVLMQIFNFFNCRKLRDEINIFSGVLSNKIFIFIVLLISVLQFVIGNYGGRALNVSVNVRFSFI